MVQLLNPLLSMTQPAQSPYRVTLPADQYNPYPTFIETASTENLPDNAIVENAQQAAAREAAGRFAQIPDDGGIKVPLPNGGMKVVYPDQGLAREYKPSGGLFSVSMGKFSPEQAKEVRNLVRQRDSISNDEFLDVTEKDYAIGELNTKMAALSPTERVRTPEDETAAVFRQRTYRDPQSGRLYDVSAKAIKDITPDAPDAQKPLGVGDFAKLYENVAKSMVVKGSETDGTPDKLPSSQEVMSRIAEIQAAHAAFTGQGIAGQGETAVAGQPKKKGYMVVSGPKGTTMQGDVPNEVRARFNQPTAAAELAASTPETKIEWLQKYITENNIPDEMVAEWERHIRADPATVDYIIKQLTGGDAPAPAEPAAPPTMVAQAQPKAELASAEQATLELDKQTAAAILAEAGGDKNKAREIARQRGYKF
jgi:hypothetical protein